MSQELTNPNKKDLNEFSEEEKQILQDIKENANERSSGSSSPVQQYVNLNARSDNGFYEVTEDGEDREVDNFEGIILKIRHSLFYFSDPEANDPFPWERLYSNEFEDHYNDVIEVKNGMNDIVARGTWQELKKMKKANELPVSMQAEVYIFNTEENKLAKMRIRGSSLSKFFDYLDTFDSDDTSARWITEFGKEKIDEGNKSYFVQTYDNRAPVNITAVKEMQEKLEDLLMKPDKKAQTAENGSQDEVEVIDIDEDENDSDDWGGNAGPDDDVKVEDIPF